MSWEEEFVRLEARVMSVASSSSAVERLQNELDDVKEELTHKKRALDDAKEVIRHEKERRAQLEAERSEGGCGNDTNRAYVIKTTAQALQKAQEDLKKKNAEIRDLKDGMQEQEELVLKCKTELDEQAREKQALERRKDQVDQELGKTKSALALARQELVEMKDRSESTSLTFSRDMSSSTAESCVEYEE